MSVNTVKISGTPISITFNQSLNITETEYTSVQKLENIVILQFYIKVTSETDIPAKVALATISQEGRPAQTVNPTGVYSNDHYTSGEFDVCSYRIGSDGVISCRESLPTSLSANKAWYMAFTVTYLAG